MQFELTSVNKLNLPGPSGDLESIVSVPRNQPQAIAIICHPHPQQQGTMHNKVVTTLEKTFLQMNMLCVRFNYRGVGSSAGEYGAIEGECEDVAAVVAWGQRNLAQLPIYFAGFSFGSFIAAWAAKRFKAKGLVTVAPSVSNMPYASLEGTTCKWLVVQGDSDDVVDCAAVQKYVAQSHNRISLHIMSGVGHFFHGNLIKLKQLIELHSSEWQ